jgi:hypothetical protein
MKHISVVTTVTDHPMLAAERRDHQAKCLRARSTASRPSHQLTLVARAIPRVSSADEGSDVQELQLSRNEGARPRLQAAPLSSD